MTDPLSLSGESLTDLENELGRRLESTEEEATRGEDLYYERWWKARMQGIILRSWDDLPASIQRSWNERAE